MQFSEWLMIRLLEYAATAKNAVETRRKKGEGKSFLAWLVSFAPMSCCARNHTAAYGPVRAGVGPWLVWSWRGQRQVGDPVEGKLAGLRASPAIDPIESCWHRRPSRYICSSKALITDPGALFNKRPILPKLFLGWVWFFFLRPGRLCFWETWWPHTQPRVYAELKNSQSKRGKS
jgi:hypothetical protein